MAEEKLSKIDLLAVATLPSVLEEQREYYFKQYNNMCRSGVDSGKVKDLDDLWYSMCSKEAYKRAYYMSKESV